MMLSFSPSVFRTGASHDVPFHVEPAWRNSQRIALRISISRWAARIRIADGEQSVGLKNYGAVLSLLVIVEAVEKGKQRRGKKPGLPL
jgi:hypothetical protein